MIDYQNAGFDDTIAQQIAQNFSANNVALMCGIATNSATACYAAAEDKNIPVIFTAITDPVKAKLDSGNITGTSDKTSHRRTAETDPCVAARCKNNRYPVHHKRT